MEWKVTQRFNYENDGYDGYNICCYPDGYCGESEFKVESMFVSAGDVSRIKVVHNIFIVKLEDYQTRENPSRVVIQRISNLQEKIAKYSGILNVIDELK
jgi:hypothetical protein